MMCSLYIGSRTDSRLPLSVATKEAKDESWGPAPIRQREAEIEDGSTVGNKRGAFCFLFLLLKTGAPIIYGTEKLREPWRTSDFATGGKDECFEHTVL